MRANKFWSTNIIRKRDNCRIWLLNREGLMFSDTVKKHTWQPRLENPKPASPQRQPTPPPPPHEATPSPKRPQRPGRQSPKPKSGNTMLAETNTLNSIGLHHQQK